MTFGDNDLKYFIQTEIFSDEKEALELTERLEAESLDVLWKNDGFITVFVGPYATQEAAEEELKALRENEIEGFINKTEFDQFDWKTLRDEIEGFVLLDSEVSNARQSKNYFVGSDIRMEGVMGTYSIFVPIDKHWEIAGNNYVDIIYSSSGISEYKYSTMTTYVNNTPVESFWIEDQDTGIKKVQVPIAPELLKEGFNNISFVSYHRLTDNLCEDDSNMANWVVLGKDTHVHLEYDELSDSDDLLDFPYPFIKTSRDLPLDFLLTVSDTPRKADLQAAMMLSAYTGKVNRFKNVNFRVDAYSKTPKTLHNIIYVGDKQSLPKELRTNFTNHELRRLVNEAVIKKIDSPFNDEKRILIIVSENPEVLLKAVQALTLPDMVAQMVSGTQWVSLDQEFVDTQIEPSEYIDLESLGYGNILFQGSKRGSSSVFVNIPSTWYISEEAKIMVKFRYSDIVNFEKSSISIYINGVPVGSKQFDGEFVQDDALILPIPAEVRQAQTYDLRFDMSLIPTNYDCESASFDTNLWGFISNETVLYLPNEERDLFSFSRYPAPFVKNGYWNDLTIILPDEVSIPALQNICDVLAYMGQDLNEVGVVDFIYASEFDEAVHNKNLIVIGTLENNSFIKTLNPEFNISLTEEGDRFEENDQIELFDAFSKNVGTIQLLYSPYAEDKMVLVVAGPTKDSVQFASKYLSDIQLFAKLNGDTAFVSGTGAFRSEFIGVDRSDFEKLETESYSAGKDIDIERKLSAKEIQKFILAVVSIFLVVIISVIVAARKRSKEARK